MMLLLLAVACVTGMAVGQEGCQIMCTLEYAPVCGTDGKTYSNQCDLTSQACLTKSGVTKEHDGECCLTMCTMEYDPVCGSDGKTYGNACELTSQACINRNGVTMAYKGVCCTVACTRVYAPVCGSDGKTYGNECELKSDACLNRNGVTMASRGACGASRERCRVRGCPRIYRPVCGTDGNTYSNNCEMRNTACRRKTTITVFKRGRC